VLSRQPSGQSLDSGQEMAVAAGCDLSTNDVAMNVSEVLNFAEPGGSPRGVLTVLEALVVASDQWAREGYAYSTGELEAAAAAASTKTDPIVVRLPGMLIDVTRWSNGTYAVTGYVQCA